MTNEYCPCGSQLQYANCCGLYIKNKMNAPSPETLMRSRYTAYTQANIDYIEKTMMGPAAKNFNRESAKQWAETVKWQRLKVISAPKTINDEGFVEFKAYYKVQGRSHVLHEISEFHKVDGQWFYVDGKHSN